MPQDFWLQVFWWINFPEAPEYTLRAVSNFFDNTLRYLQLKVQHRYSFKFTFKMSAVICILFSLFATSINNTSSTVGKICRHCSWYWWQICHGVVDTCGKFAASIGVTLLAAQAARPKSDEVLFYWLLSILLVSLTRIPSGESIWGSGSKKDRLLKNQGR